MLELVRSLPVVRQVVCAKGNELGIGMIGLWEGVPLPILREEAASLPCEVRDMPRPSPFRRLFDLIHLLRVGRVAKIWAAGALNWNWLRRLCVVQPHAVVLLPA